jgi:hypothetical protein
MRFAELAVVLVVVGVVACIFLFLPRRGEGGPGSSRGEWRTNHYDVDGVTRVVLQKVKPGGINVLNEHVIATLPIDDPEYDAKFMAAMSTARERRAVYESEQE